MQGHARGPADPRAHAVTRAHRAPLNAPLPLRRAAGDASMEDCLTIGCARTFLQPQLQKSCRAAEVIACFIS